MYVCMDGRIQLYFLVISYVLVCMCVWIDGLMQLYFPGHQLRVGMNVCMYGWTDATLFSGHQLRVGMYVYIGGWMDATLISWP